MKVRALRSFSGGINMSRGEERNISDTAILNDLYNAGYIEILSTSATQEDEEKPEEEKPEQDEKPKKKGKKGSDANEDQ